MSVRQELKSGKIFVVVGNGNHGQISELVTKWDIDDLYQEIQKEVEDELQSKMSEGIVFTELGKNIEYFTSNRWMIKVGEGNNAAKVIMGLPHAGLVINQEASVYVPPFIVIVDYEVGRGGKVVGAKCWAYLYQPGTTLDGYIQKRNLLHLNKIHPHSYANGTVCTGSGLGKFPVIFDLNVIVLWINAFTDDFGSYNPRSPVTQITNCLLGQELLQLKIEGKSDSDIIKYVLERRKITREE